MMEILQHLFKRSWHTLYLWLP